MFDIIEGMENDRVNVKRLIAANIKKYRTKAGLTQEVAAEKADLSLNYWQRLEMTSQKDIPSIPTLIKIARVLHTDLKSLIS